MKGEHTLDDIPISLYTTSETRPIHWRKEREKEKERTGERERASCTHTYTQVYKCVSDGAYSYLLIARASTSSASDSTTG